MGKEFSVSEKVGEAGLILAALGVVGFIGVIWLLIYGNLSGNLGFGQDNAAFSNQTTALSTSGSTPAGADNRVHGAISTVVMTNATGGEIIESTNYTVSGVVITGVAGSEYDTFNVNVSYSLAFDSEGLINTENVISNVSGGFSTFFTFSETFFTIAAIVLLIFMFLGLLSIVVLIMKMQQSKGKGFTE